MSLTFTGERFLPQCAGEMVYEHWQRYLIARQYVQGKRVLDVASGEGYGSHLLASAAREVVGVDLSTDAIAHAGATYQAGNLRYLAASCLQIPEPDASFDVVVSFETIEHIVEHEAFIREVDRLLKPGGMFIISSPNRPEYTDKTGYRNEFHVKELDRAELKALLAPHFPAQRWFAQRAAFHSMVWPLDGAATAAEALATDGSQAYPGELYFLVFCGKDASTLSGVVNSLSLVTDRDASVYAEWSRTYRDNAALYASNTQLQQQIEQLKAAAPQATAVPLANEPWLVRLARKLSGGQ